ncbi:pogo transposable element with KRAB domain [Rhizophagus irregularis DAOM 181602=DAOM 197198]|nr:pogo transposable element with KRAB domain [Rhizophagus irregularis DAOM 181602=DAOM 197198]CAB4489943.1 unnamed protein product [Rhizophagus irregularis]
MTHKKVGVRQCTSYSLEEKLIVVKQSSKWEEENKKKKHSETSGRKAFYLKAEKILYSWIIEQRKKGFAINYISIRLQMCKILKESSIQALYSVGEYEFQRNLSWINSFIKRFGLSLRRKTKISQKLPEDLEEKLDEFRRYIIRLKTLYNFDLNSIFNMDETPV